MEKKFISLVVFALLFACVKKEELVVIESEPLPPMGSNITERSRDAVRPIPKPAPPSQLQTTRVISLSPGEQPDLTVSKTLPPKINGVPQITYTKILIVNDGQVMPSEKKPVEVLAETVSQSEPKLVKTEDIKTSKAKPMRNKEQSTLGALTDGLANDTEDIRGRVAKFLFPEFDDPEPEPPKGKLQAEVFCYGSWSESTCYSKPIPGQEFRRVGSTN